MIAAKTFREAWGMALAYTIILELLMIPAIKLWPPLYDDMQRGLNIASMLPDFMQRAMAGMSDDNEVTAYRNYMAIQLFFKGVNIAGLACAVLMGTGIVARERENQTLEFLLARPVRRSRILWSKFWVLALCITVPIFLTSITANWWSRGIDLELPYDVLLNASFHSAAFVLLIFTATTVFSVLCRNQVHVAFWIGGIVILQVAIFFVPDIRQGSIFMLSDFDLYGPVLIGNTSFGQLLLGPTKYLLGGTIALYALADRLFGRIEL